MSEPLSIPSAETSERRAHKRYPSQRRATIALAEGVGACCQAVTHNLSAGGMRLGLAVMFGRNSAVEISLAPAEARSGNAVQLRAQVAWCRQSGKGWECGLRLFMRLRTGGVRSSLSNHSQALLAIAQVARQLPAADQASLVPLDHLAPDPGSSRKPRRGRRVLLLLPLLLLPLFGLLFWDSPNTIAERDSTRTPPEQPWVGVGGPEEMNAEDLHVILSNEAVDSASAPVNPPLLDSTASPESRFAETPAGQTKGGPPAASPEQLLHRAETWMGARRRPAETQSHLRGIITAHTVPGVEAAARAEIAEQLSAAGDNLEAAEVLKPVAEGGRAIPQPWENLACEWLESLEAGEAIAPRESIDLLPAAGPAAPTHLQLIIDTAQYILTVYRGPAVIAAFPVGLGMDNRTPRGEFVIANKIKHPTWFHRGTGIPPGDPRNPLGDYWLGLGDGARATSYGIHPTTDPGSIGQNKSRGCIRMRPQDAEKLFMLCGVGTPVSIAGPDN